MAVAPVLPIHSHRRRVAVAGFARVLDGLAHATVHDATGATVAYLYDATGDLAGLCRRVEHIYGVRPLVTVAAPLRVEP